MKKNIFKNNKLIKILAWTGFATLISGGVAGTVVGVVNFAEDSSQNKGTNFENSVETVINVSLDSNKTDNENLEVIDNLSDRLIERIQQLGVSQIEIKSSMQYLPITITNNDGEASVAYTPYGSIHIFTEQNIPAFSIDFESDNYVSRISSQLSLYNYLSNSYDYNLCAVNANNGHILNESSLPNASKVNKNFNEIYDLNTSKNIAYVNDNNINIPLSLLENDQDWNLDVMQKQFTEVYNWDGEESRADVVTASQESGSTQTYSIDTINSDENTDSDSSTGETETFIKTTPKLTYLYWQNRTGFINKLQWLSTIAFLYNNRGAFTESDYNKYPDYQNDPYNFPVTIIDQFWEEFHNTDLSSDEAIFMDWVITSNDYYDIMKTLYEANQTNYGIDNSQDPLLTLLHDFFSSKTYQASGKLDFSDNNNQYQYLYSWNSENITLFDSYLTTIDYNNFFNYFTDNTDSEDTEVIKNSYKSNEFIVYDPTSSSNLNTKTDFINNTSFENPVLMTEMISPIFEVNSSPKEIYNDFISFCNSFVFQYPNFLSNSITKLSPFNGVLIGISVLILIIGIIISILYKYPGVLSFISSIFSFGFSFLMMMALNSLLSISTYVAFIVSIICMFIPFINSQIHFRNSIRYNKNNFFNAFLNSVKSFIKTSIMTYIPLIVISLTCLFFGKNQINEFGSSLIIPIFSNLIWSCVIFLILYAMSYWLFMKNNPRFALNNQYISILNRLKIRGAKFSIENTNTIIDRALNKLFAMDKPKILIYTIIPALLLILGLIGVIIFATIGPAFIGNAYNSTQLSIYFVNSDYNQVSQLLNNLSDHFNIKWESSQLINNVYKNGDGIYVSQYILISQSQLNINEIFLWLKANNFNPNIISNLSFMILNESIPTLLFNNAIQCMFIAVAFISIFTIIYVNFINFIPIVIISILTNIAVIGFIGLLRIPMDMNTIIILLGLFAISNIFIFTTYNNILWKFNKKIEHSYKSIIDYGLKQIKLTIKLQLYMLAASLLYGLLLMLFVSTDLIYNQLLLWIGTIILFIISVPLSFVFCILVLCLREWYISKVRKNRKSHENKVVYDKIDEQMIVGINAH